MNQDDEPFTFNDKDQYITDLEEQFAEAQRYVAELEQTVKEFHQYILDHETGIEIGKKLFQRMPEASQETVRKFCEIFYPDHNPWVLAQRFNEAKNKDKPAIKRRK